MKAIILAAGRGSRMGQLTTHSPKCLVKLAGRPLLDYQLSAILAAGIKDIAIVTGYNHQMIIDSRIQTKLINTNWEHTNMVRSLMVAEDLLNQESCIISYSDIFYSANAIQSLMQLEADIAITYDINFLKLWSARFENPLADLETFKINHQSQLTEIGNRPSGLDDIEGQFMGLIKLTPNGWSIINSFLQTMQPDALNKLDITSLLKQLIANEVNIYTTPHNQLWGEVDNANDLALYESWAVNWGPLPEVTA